MAEVEAAPSFGAELKDAFKPVNSWVTTGINWLEDIQSFYRERSAIEKEYSAKLSALAKKYHEKKAKKIGTLSVGDTPSLTPGSLERLVASLTIWTTQITTVEKRAAEHDRYATELLLQVAEPIKNVSLRFEEVRKSHVEYAAKLEKERDAAYTTLKRSKGQYDGACQEVESRRKKTESSFDSSKAKAQNAYQQQQSEMNNVKNSYLISINVMNKQKEKHYYEYVPELLDSMQSLSETRVSFTNTMWSLASKLENDAMLRSVEHMQFLTSEIPRNDPKLDSIMFIRHNVTQWQEPPDMGFEPSPVWHDDSGMVVDETAKVFLKNILLKSKSQRNDLKREVEQKKNGVDKARQIRQNIREGKDKRDEVDVVKAIFSLQEDLHESERKWIIADVESSTITSVVGDISIGAQNHNFKSQTFKIPTNCDLCGERIWGLSAKGFDCLDCGYTCHSKCQMKVPADCPGQQSKEDKKKLKAERQAAAAAVAAAPSPSTNGGPPPEGVAELSSLSRSNTMNSLSSGYATSAQRSVSGASNLGQDGGAAGRKNRVIAPPPTSYVSEVPGDMPNGGRSRLETKGRTVFPYQASDDGELTIDEGAEFILVEPDDGSGWITIQVGGATGVVPASYCEINPPTPTPERPTSYHSTSSVSVTGSTSTGPTGKKKGPAVAPKRGAKKLHHVEAMYDYAAQSDAEFSMSEGDRFVLISKDAGDGWAEVEKGGQTKSVPANYIKDV